MKSIFHQTTFGYQVITFHFGPGLFHNGGPHSILIGSWFSKFENRIAILKQHRLIDGDDPWLTTNVKPDCHSIGSIGRVCHEH